MCNNYVKGVVSPLLPKEAFHPFEWALLTFYGFDINETASGCELTFSSDIGLNPVLSRTTMHLYENEKENITIKTIFALLDRIPLTEKQEVYAPEWECILQAVLSHPCCKHIDKLKITSAIWDDDDDIDSIGGSAWVITRETVDVCDTWDILDMMEAKTWPIAGTPNNNELLGICARSVVALERTTNGDWNHINLMAEIHRRLAAKNLYDDVLKMYKPELFKPGKNWRCVELHDSVQLIRIKFNLSDHSMSFKII